MCIFSRKIFDLNAKYPLYYILYFNIKYFIMIYVPLYILFTSVYVNLKAL